MNVSYMTSSKKPFQNTALALRFVLVGLPCAAFGANDTPPTPTQSITPDDVLTVRPRAISENLSVGIRAGEFLISPGLELVNTYDDNIFRTKYNRSSDWVSAAKPALALQSNWERHVIFLGAEGDFGVFRKNTQQNYSDYGLLASGQYDFTAETNLIGALSRAKRHEDLGTLNNPNGQAPLNYTIDRQELRFTHTMGLIKWETDGYNENVSLSNIAQTTPNNASQTRTNKNIDTTLTFQYMPGNDIYAKVGYNKADYQIPTVSSLTARGVDWRTGMHFDRIHNITGGVFAGQIRRSYKIGNPDTHKTFAGTTLDWAITPLTTLSGIIDRTFDDSTVTNAAGILHTTRKITLRQSFTERFEGEVFGGVDNNNYTGGDSTTNRNTTLYYTGVGSNYKLTDHFGIRIEYNHQERTSTLASDEYKDNKIFLSLSWML